MLAQGTAARFKFTFHPYYCWSRLSTSCLLHEIGKRHITRYCWPWCFRARRGRYDSFPRGWAVIALRPYWLRCVSAPRSSFVIRRPLSALAKDFCYRHDLRSRSSGAPFRTLRKFRYATLGPSGCRTLCVFPFCKGCVFRSNTYKNFRSRAPVKPGLIPHLFALYENSVTPGLSGSSTPTPAIFHTTRRGAACCARLNLGAVYRKEKTPGGKGT